MSEQIDNGSKIRSSCHPTVLLHNRNEAVIVGLENRDILHEINLFHQWGHVFIFISEVANVAHVIRRVKEDSCRLVKDGALFLTLRTKQICFCCMSFYLYI